ncbi:hypothetical protein ACJX0J_028443, partial [Zea mays]
VVAFRLTEQQPPSVSGGGGGFISFAIIILASIFSMYRKIISLPPLAYLFIISLAIIKLRVYCAIYSSFVLVFLMYYTITILSYLLYNFVFLELLNGDHAKSISAMSWQIVFSRII